MVDDVNNEVDTYTIETCTNLVVEEEWNLRAIIKNGRNDIEASMYRN